MIYLGPQFLFMVSCFYPTTANLWVQVPNNNPRTESRSIHSFESSRQKTSIENGVSSEVDDSEYYYYDGGTDPLISQREPIAQQEPDDFLQTFTFHVDTATTVPTIKSNLSRSSPAVAPTALPSDPEPNRTYAEPLPTVSEPSPNIESPNTSMASHSDHTTLASSSLESLFLSENTNISSAQNEPPPTIKSKTAVKALAEVKTTRVPRSLPTSYYQLLSLVTRTTNSSIPTSPHSKLAIGNLSPRENVPNSSHSHVSTALPNSESSTIPEITTEQVVDLDESRTGLATKHLYLGFLGG